MTDPMDRLIQWLNEEEKVLRESILEVDLGHDTYTKLKHERRILLEVRNKAVAMRNMDYMVMTHEG